MLRQLLLVRAEPHTDLLYTEGVPFDVKAEENDKGKIIYEVTTNESDQVVESLMEKYHTLIL